MHQGERSWQHYNTELGYFLRNRQHVEVSGARNGLRILSHQHYPNPHSTICSTLLPVMPISSRSAPTAGLRFCQVRSTFEINLLVD